MHSTHRKHSPKQILASYLKNCFKSQKQKVQAFLFLLKVTTAALPISFCIGGFIASFIVSSYVSLDAQTTQSSEKNFTPKPYQKEEFPPFLRDLRRFEIILFGTIPITFLLSSLAYDIVYSASNPNIHSLVSDSSNQAILGKIGISISISGILAVVDMIIHLAKRHKRRKDREKLRNNSEYIGIVPEAREEGQNRPKEKDKQQNPTRESSSQTAAP